jgi:cysteine desulfurase/selenocysteine lyase
MICEKTGAKVVPAPITPRGELDIPAFEKLLSERTKIVAVGHVSNALGTVNPIADLVAKAHTVGASVVVDGAQAVPHLQVDVQALACDFYAFSSHKMFGPTGIGVLYGKSRLLEAMPPYQGGGEMILTVSFEKTTYNTLPHKFEAGTPHITGAIGLGATIDYLASIDFEARSRYEDELLRYASSEIQRVPGIRIIGEAAEKIGILSFNLGEIHAHDLGTILDRDGIAVRTGHHCAMPVMEYFDVPATARASFAFYNNREDVDRLIQGLRTALELFS